MGWTRIVGFRAAVDARLGKRPHDHAAFAHAPDAGLVRLGLDDRQAAFAFACVAVAVDPLLYPHMIATAGVDGRRGLSPAAYATLVGLDEVDAIELAAWLATTPPIVRFRLLERDGDDYLSSATPYRATSRLVEHLREHQAEREGARAGTYRHADAQVGAIEAMARGLTSGRVVLVTGMRGSGRRTAIGLAVRTPTCVLDASRLDVRDFERELRRTCADAILRGALPVVVDPDRIEPDGERDRRAGIGRILASVLDDVPGPAAVVTAAGFEVPVLRALDRVGFPLPDVATRVLLWEASLGDRPVDRSALKHVALRHVLGAGPIAAAATAALTAAPGETLGTKELLVGIRDVLADRFGPLAERLEVSDQWSDVVLSPETNDQLASLISRVQHEWTVFEDWRFPRNTARGGGVRALFSRPPGTGKTMVAGLIARELGRDLYRIDLSQIVSKWVGETEKQLGQVFDAAESGNALLLFDEADSLFAKRTEVKSSSDRYANLEVNYLLQRIETFSGMTILTTNLDTAIDPAMRRRLAAHVVFWPPEHDERVTLWQRFLKTRAPTAGDINFDELATAYPDMTGANIRNAALATAFLAARENGKIDGDRAHRAARAEYRAMGRVLSGRK